MATKIGPKTVTQRDRSKALAFCVDAANSDSYGGEPTTNLCANSSFGANGDVALTSNVTVRGQSFTRKCVNNSSSSTTPGLWPIDSTITVSQSTQYTFSLRGFSNTTTGGGNAYLYVKNQSAGSDLVWNTAIGAFPTEDEYFANPANEIVSHTFTTPSGCTQLKIGVLFTGHSTTPGGIFYIKDIQLEAKSAPTPFVLGSRTASNAVENISGVGAQDTTITGDFSNGPYGQQLFKPTNRKVLASFNINQGHIGGAFWDFDGSDECIVIPYADDSSLDLTRGTIIAWFKASGGGHNGVIVGWGSAGTDNYGNIAITSNWTGGYADESFVYNRYKGSASYIQMYIRKGHNFYADSTWHCVAVTSHGGASDLGNIYIDGELQTITTTSSIGDGHPFMNIKDSTAKFLNIGRRPYNSGAEFFNGEIANTMIWSSSLTSKEIKYIYIAQKARFGK